MLVFVIGLRQRAKLADERREKFATRCMQRRLPAALADLYIAASAILHAIFPAAILG